MAVTTNPARTSRERRGSAVALLVCGGFGFAWAGWGISAGVPGAIQAAVLVVAGVCLGACILLARTLFRLADAAAPGTDEQGGRLFRRRFTVIVVAEFVGLFVIARILTVSGQPEAICAVVCLGVGIHFFPLARLFDVPTYNATATATCVIALVGGGAAIATGNAHLWTMIPGLGASLTLFVTGLGLRLLPALR